VVGFGPIEVEYDDTVLTPRPWTLAQSEWAAELSDGEVMLELGCGAGQIGLAGAVLSGSCVIQVDRHEPACWWAARNAERNGCADLAEQRCGTASEVLAEGESFSLVLADPPYVPSAEVGAFPDDPLGAIDGGVDGLTEVRSFLAGVVPHLRPGADVLLQLRGLTQVDQLQQWLTHSSTLGLAIAETRVYGADRSVTRLVSQPTGQLFNSTLPLSIST